MNIKEYTEHCLENNRETVIKRLDNIQALMNGSMCYESSLRSGKASSFLIAILTSYFEEVLDKSLETYLEVGVLYGGSLCTLAESGFKGKAYGCDIYKGYYGNLNDSNFPSGYKCTTEGHIKAVYDNIKIFSTSEMITELICGNTLDEKFIKELSNKNIEPLDVLYIDGLHTLAGCNADWDAYSPYMKSGGFVLIDNIETKPIQESVENHIKPNKIKPITSIGTLKIDSMPTTWIGQIK